MGDHNKEVNGQIERWMAVEEASRPTPRAKERDFTEGRARAGPQMPKQCAARGFVPSLSLSS